jgi:CDP-glucose 4,6-dehydratase
LFNNQFKDRIVLVTGHTGFKGSWLCEWLLRLGAKVHGLALDPEPHERLFGELGLSERLASDIRYNIQQPDRLSEFVGRIQPDFIFHLAAQPLVRKSFETPVDTFKTNVMGTINLLEAIRTNITKSCVAIIVTTDKCYENREWLHSYREIDAMGGYDPYSASKGCAEIAVASYRRSFFMNTPTRLASARAGNVIGGGDWATDRIVPDIFRSIFSSRPVTVRNKTSTRPWQHVLEPLSGYLLLASNLFVAEAEKASELSSAFNFGPPLKSNRTVKDLVELFLKRTGGTWIDASNPNSPHEASKLNLAIDKAFHVLGWYPTWDFETTVDKTVEWYHAVNRGADPREITIQHLREFQSSAEKLGYLWAN